jgi:hypothetical protein
MKSQGGHSESLVVRYVELMTFGSGVVEWWVYRQSFMCCKRVGTEGVVWAMISGSHEGCAMSGDMGLEGLWVFGGNADMNGIS